MIGVGAGFISLVNLVEGRFVPGMLWMISAAVFDGIDGKVASLLNSRSEAGSAIDSLGDVLSFGLLPGFSLYLFYRNAPQDNTLTEIAAWVTGICYTWAGVMREVRFVSTQLERTRAEGFIGLPIAPPAGLNIGLVSLANLFPETLYNTAGLTLVLLIVITNIYLMTKSTINYKRWGGRAIALQMSVSIVPGIVAFIAWETFGAFVAVYLISVSSVYILTHLLQTLYRMRPGYQAES